MNRKRDTCGAIREGPCGSMRATRWGGSPPWVTTSHYGMVTHLAIPPKSTFHTLVPAILLGIGTHTQEREKGREREKKEEERKWKKERKKGERKRERKKKRKRSEYTTRFSLNSGKSLVSFLSFCNFILTNVVMNTRDRSNNPIMVKVW